MPRKKKPTRKYEPRNEFRINNSPHANGHPHYIFGEKNGKYKSLGLTTSPRPDVRSVELSKNPEPSNTDKSYLQFEVHTAKKSYYRKDVLQGWGFAPEDMPVVRHRIKKYKKSYNRKPPMYYEKKRQQKKEVNFVGKNPSNSCKATYFTSSVIISHFNEKSIGFLKIFVA